MNCGFALSQFDPFVRVIPVYPGRDFILTHASPSGIACFPFN